METPSTHSEQEDAEEGAEEHDEGPPPRVEVTPDESPDPGRVHWDRWDSLIVAAAFVATFSVHPVHLALSRPYWLDEAWVAVLTRLPFSRFRQFSSSTPVGFVTLLKLVPGSGLQRARMMVLVFSAATAAMAYVIVRGCRWGSKPFARAAAAAAALVVMLAPLSLTRNDLKQYTCDAFCALVVLAVAAWVDRPPGNTPVWWLSIASLVVLPFSSTSAFVSVAAFAGVLGSALSTRSRRRITEVLVTGAATGAALGGFFAAVIIPNTNDSLRAYWNASYLSGSPLHILHVSWTRLTALQGSLGTRAIGFVALFVAGLVVLAALQARAVAIAAPVLWIEMLLAARLRRYPFLDQRTSHFLLVSSLVVCAIGAAGIVRAASRWRRELGGVISIVLAVTFVLGVRSHIRQLNIPHEDARAQTAYVAAHRAPDDVILVNQAGAYAFSYYWPHGSIATPINNEMATGFFAEVDGLDAVYASGRTDATVLAALREATGRLRAAGPGSRMFIVRSHLNRAEVVAWSNAFATFDLHPRSIHTGVEPLLEVDTP
jgi:hypothetical protein